MVCRIMYIVNTLEASAKFPSFHIVTKNKKQLPAHEFTEGRVSEPSQRRSGWWRRQVAPARTLTLTTVVATLVAVLGGLRGRHVARLLVSRCGAATGRVVVGCGVLANGFSRTGGGPVQSAGAGAAVGGLNVGIV